MSGSPPPSVPTSDPKPAPRRPADWGGKAIVVFALAFLMSVPGVFVFALIADRAKAAGVTTVVFDRGGNLYHGRVAAVADAAREGGLEF